MSGPLRCQTCGRVQRRYHDINIEEAKRLAAEGYAVTRAAEFLGVHRKTLAKVADEQGITFKFRRGGAYNPRNCGRPGEQNGSAKITQQEADFIAASPLSTREIAVRYGISTVQVNKIRRGVAWKAS